ncbi:hypothetical protein RD792_003811 [Penstemon davidsonii]|uniref:Uncharacterized protein n=1 Tax=Penstemon davidsonii TaxID=160366 RepID=A0ABR0DGB5_9LAMI|nr:hypothetical protein RD792_003811 [Penstemon davidsonii]
MKTISTMIYLGTMIYNTLEECNNQNMPLETIIHSVIANCIKEILNITDNNVDEVKEPTLCLILSAKIFKNLGILETETRPRLVKVHQNEQNVFIGLSMLPMNTGLSTNKKHYT